MGEAEEYKEQSPHGLTIAQQVLTDYFRTGIS